MIALDARSTVILGRHCAVFHLWGLGLGFKVLYRIEREKLVAGRVTVLPAEEVLNCGFVVDGGGNKLATIILVPEDDERDAFKDVSLYTPQ